MKVFALILTFFMHEINRIYNFALSARKPFFSMKAKYLITSMVAFTIFFVQAHAQDKSSYQFHYDPIFWSETLKLTSEQRNEIIEINSVFYTQVTSLERTTSTYLNQLQTFLQERNLQIYNSFRARQKKRWDKIIEGFSSPSP